MRTTFLKRLLPATMLGLLFCGCAAHRTASRADGGEPRPEAQPGLAGVTGPPAPVKISPEQAFRKGILALKDKVDFYDKTGVVKFYRLESGSWYMQVTRYPGVPLGGIWAKIGENGQVETGHGF